MKGISYVRYLKKYKACIYANRVRYSLGTWLTERLAKIAILIKKRELIEKEFEELNAKEDEISFVKNQLNKKTSKYRGVSRGDGVWVSSVYNGKKIFLGNFIKEESAAKKYDKYVREHNLNRKLNFE